MVANWNRCLELCAGDWVKIMGQDDILAEDCLDASLRANAGRHDLVLSLRELSFEAGVPSGLRLAYQWYLPTMKTLAVAPGTVTPEVTAGLITRVSPCTNFLGEPVCGLFSRVRQGEMGAYDNVLGQVADYEYWLRLALNGPFTYVDRPLASFRVHRGSATRANLEDRLRGVHLPKAALLVQLLEGPAYRGARQRHPPLAPFLENALLSEFAAIRRLAGRSEENALTVRRALEASPPLAAWYRREPTPGDSLRAMVGRVDRAGKWLATVLGGRRRRGG